MTSPILQRFVRLSSLAMICFLLMSTSAEASFFSPVRTEDGVGSPVDVGFYEADTRKRKTYKVMSVSEPIRLGENPKRFVDVPTIELTHRETGAKGIYRILADGEGLYIGGEVTDKRLNSYYRDKLWMDDSIEIMLDVDNNRGNLLKTNDFKFLANLVNSQYSSQAGKASWDGEFDSEVSYEGTLNNNRDTDEGYVVEVKIPWSTLGLAARPQAGEAFGFELGLNDSIAKTQYQWFRQRFWSNSNGGSANDPNGWGVIIFSDEVIKTAPELSFTASNHQVYAGGGTTLSWSAIRAGYCFASGDWEGEKPLVGSQPISEITIDKAFTLTCGGYGGTVTKTIRVEVIPPEDPDAVFSVDKVVSVNGADFQNDIELRDDESAYYRVIVKNEGQVAGSITLYDALTLPTNGGGLGPIKDFARTCPPRAVCGTGFGAEGLRIENLEPEESVVITYTRTASALGIPSGSHSIIVDSAHLADDLGASTAAVTLLANYAVIDEEVCPDADFVVPTEMWVAGEGCHASGRVQDSAAFLLDVAGSYDVAAYVERGESGQCNTQTNESFRLDINGKTGGLLADDADECTVSSRNQFAGTYDLKIGENAVIMNTASQCPPDSGANSVRVTHLCLNRIPDRYEVPSLETAFALDGHHNEFDDSFSIMLGGEDRFAGDIRLVATADALHVLAEVRDADLVSTGEGRDQDLSQDDFLALMFDIDQSLGYEPQNGDYRFWINLNNAKTDANGSDYFFNADFESVVRYNGTRNDAESADVGYSIEAKIPWYALGLDAEPQAGDTIGFEVALADAKSDESPTRHVWSNASGGSLDDPNGWGELFFLGKSLTLAPQLSFTQSASVVQPQGAVQLDWHADNADRCVALGDWSGLKDLTGSEIVSGIDSTKTFTLVCENEYETVVKSATVAVSEFAPTLSLIADKTAVESGDGLRLTWSATNASTCIASGGWQGQKPTNGSEEIVALSAATGFSLTCLGQYGTVTRSVFVDVVADAPTLEFAADKTAISSGEAVTLTWSSQNTAICVPSGGWGSGDSPFEYETHINQRLASGQAFDEAGFETRPPSGSETISGLTGSKVFHLTCYGLSGAITRSVAVVVDGIPPVTDTPTPPSPPGVPTTTCHQITQADLTAVPDHFGVPWDVFASTRNIILRAFCLAERVSFVVGNDDPTTYIWHSGYMTKNSTNWEPITYSGTHPVGSGEWLAKKAGATATLSPTQMRQPNYVLAYTCRYIDNAWKCGCRDGETCNENGKWTFQIFRYSLPTPPPIPSPPPTAEQTIADIVANDARLQTLAVAIEAAGLTQSLRQPEQRTLFAPTDTAFAKFTPDVIELLLLPENQALLSNILQYHLTRQKLPARNLPIGFQYEMQNGAKVSFSQSDDGLRVFINNAEIIVTDIEASNGIIHLIDTVLLPVENYEINALLGL